MGNKSPSWKEIFEEIEDVHINLLLTRRCNFSCAHCMYAAGPKLPGQYMQPHDFEAIRFFIDQIKTHKDIPISVNFVGGEPTLDLPQFHQILKRIIPQWDDCEFEMTTNGWWLEKIETLHAFGRAVLPHLEEERLSIRISQSPYHTPFRSKSFNALIERCKTNPYDYGEKKPTSLENLLSYENLWLWLWDNENFQEDQDFTQETNTLERLQEQAKDHKIAIDYQDNGTTKISPVGRAKLNQFGTQDGGCHTTNDVKFTFMPGRPEGPAAPLYDPCCNGGHVPLGHAQEGLELFFRRIAFMEALHKSYPGKNLQGNRCFNCPSFGAKWIQNEKKKLQPKILKTIRSLQTQLITA